MGSTQMDQTAKHEPQTKSGNHELQGQSNQKIYILMVFATLFWSGAFIAGKYTVPYIPVFTLTFLRFFVATIILYFVVKYNKGKKNLDFKLKREHCPIFLFTGLVGMMGYHVLFFTSLKYTTAINSSIIAATNPIITIILAYFFLKQKMKGLQAVGVIVSFVGVVLTITGADWEIFKTFAFNKGDLWMLAAAVAWASYGVYSKSKASHIPPLALTYYSFLVCTVALIPFALWEQPWTFLGQVPAAGYVAVLYMSIFPSVIGYLVQQMAIQQIGPGKSAIFVNLVPFFSMMLAVFILGEQLEPVKVLTAMLIILGVYICQKN